VVFSALPDRAKNCFGKPDRDKGHNLLPEPPHKITGSTVVIKLGEISSYAFDKEGTILYALALFQLDKVNLKRILLVNTNLVDN
jgi:hypothetical protein